MSIIGIFNGWNIIALPCDTVAGVTAPSSIEWNEQDVVAANDMIFTGQEQVYDWQAAWWEATVSFSPMTRASHDAWSAFLSECRGKLNTFLIGDPKAAKPKGQPGASVPVVSGAGQTGFSLATRGWMANGFRLLLPGDHLQIGYRLYKALDVVNSDAGGNATFRVWPQLRDLPADGAQIVLAKPRGLFRLKNNSGNKHSTNVGSYGFTGLAIREAI